MPSAGTLIAITAATLALIAIPGPSTFFLLGRGLTVGRRRALLSALGVETGSLLFVCLTAFGLSAAIASTAWALTALHYLGGTYLLFLAWRAWRAGDGVEAPARLAPGSAWTSYRQGLMVGASNPKVALFFLAFFPQFVDPARGSATAQILVMGTLFVALALLADTINCCAAGAIGRQLARRPGFGRARRRIEATFYAGLGTWTLLR